MSPLDWLPWRRARLTGDLADELRAHLEMSARDRIARGESPANAAAHARREFGNVGLVQEIARDEWGAAGRWTEYLAQDIRFAFRMLRRAPAFTTIVIITMALGIGATTAIFSVVDSVVLKPLPYPESDRIVRLYQLTDKGARNSVSQPNFHDWAERAHSFSGMALLSGWTGTSTVETPTGPTLARVTPVTRDFFTVLGIHARLGRLFVPEEQRFGGQGAAVISDAFARGQFGAEHGAIGRQITWGNHSYTVVGVLPATADYPQGNQIWVPMELLPPSTGRTSQGYTVIARLRTGVTKEAARRDLSAVSRQMKAEYGNQTAMSDATLVGLREQMVGDVRPRLFLLLGASAFLLLIGLANALNLMATRLVARRSELAVRVALGAAPVRLVRQVLVESSVLVGLAAFAGVWLAAVAVRLVVAAPASALPRAGEITVDWQVLAFTAAVAALLSLALGGMSAARIAGQQVRDALSANSRTVAASGAALRRSTVVAQVSLTVVLLSGAALLGRSFLNLLRVNPGFSTDHVAVIDATASIEDQRQRLDYYNTLIDRVRALPGVSAVGAGTGVPIANSPPDGGYLMLDAPTDSITSDAWRSFPASRKGHANYVVVDGAYFQALGIPLKQGRVFDARDGIEQQSVAVVSERFATQSWPGENPIGKVVAFGNMDTDWRSFTVIGVVGDVHDDGLAAAPPPTFYAYYPQRLRTYWPLSLAVRTTGDPSSVIASIRRIVHDIRPDVAVRARTIDRVVATSVADQRFTVFIVAAFAAAALVLATLGVYGIVSYVVTQRTREIGVRVALGAQRSDVLGLVVGEGLRLSLAGIAIGIVLSLLLTRVMAALVFGVSTTDPIAFGAVTVLLLLVALVAAYIPGRRATRLDPLEVLRSS
ncbi:MAG TPA: ABC transporter permease [Gemmatimonadaceae bacterium]